MMLPVAIPEGAQGRILTSVGGLYTVETSSGICTCKARGVPKAWRAPICGGLRLPFGGQRNS